MFPSLTSVYCMLTLKPTAHAFDKSQIHIRALRTAAKRAVRSFSKMVVTFEPNLCGHTSTNYMSDYGEV